MSSQISNESIPDVLARVARNNSATQHLSTWSSNTLLLGLLWSSLFGSSVWLRHITLMSVMEDRSEMSDLFWRMFESGTDTAWYIRYMSVFATRTNVLIPLSVVVPAMATTSHEAVFIENPDQIPPDSVPDNFVSHTIKNQEALPPVTWENWYKELHWLHVFILFVPPIIGIIGALYTPLCKNTAIWLVVYSHFTGIGLTAGYHRLWAHRTYKATRTLEYVLAILGAGVVEGSIAWWARGHRAHHRYTDTDLDPYDARKGLFYSHMGWMIFKPRRKPGPADVSDLRSNPVVKWQHNFYLPLAFVMAVVIPTCVPGYWWGDWQGGFIWASMIRLVCVQHSTFCVNSLCHWLGEKPYDDKLTAKDCVLTALITLGEAYHNFHHLFPMDYRNGHKWYHYDPTKWFLWSCAELGLATHLKMVSENEIMKGELTVQLKRLRQDQEALSWPNEKPDLPVISWEDYQRQSESRSLICIAGFIHDVGGFYDKHPGGAHLLKKNIGKDATPAFFGGLYDHSNAAHNLLAMKRVGILLGGVPHGSEEQVLPPSQRLRVARRDELSI